MTATMTAGSKSSINKAKAKLKDPEFYIKAGSLVIFGSMVILEAGLAIVMFVFAASIVDVLLGILFLGGAFLFGGFFMATLDS